MAVIETRTSAATAMPRTEQEDPRVVLRNRVIGMTNGLLYQIPHITQHPEMYPHIQLNPDSAIDRSFSLIAQKGNLQVSGKIRLDGRKIVEVTIVNLNDGSKKTVDLRYMGYFKIREESQAGSRRDSLIFLNRTKPDTSRVFDEVQDAFVQVGILALDNRQQIVVPSR